MTFDAVLGHTAEIVAGAFEAAGIATMALGAITGAAQTARARPSTWKLAVRDYRQRLGRAIVLGLEFLVAADILRTVRAVPTLQEVAVLGAIVVIRTILSFSLEVELEGRWPWQPRRPELDAATGAERQT
jgi:uncharacterized membrane protein